MGLAGEQKKWWGNLAVGTETQFGVSPSGSEQFLHCFLSSSMLFLRSEWNNTAQRANLILAPSTPGKIRREQHIYFFRRAQFSPFFARPFFPGKVYRGRRKREKGRATLFTWSLLAFQTRTDTGEGLFTAGNPTFVFRSTGEHEDCWKDGGKGRERGKRAFFTDQNRERSDIREREREGKKD